MSAFEPPVTCLVVGVLGVCLFIPETSEKLDIDTLETDSLDAVNSLSGS